MNSKRNIEERGRFAPSPTGRMHLGNIWAALHSYLSVKRRGGAWILRHEDLDSQRSKQEYARLIEDDLLWLGLQWDEGGLENRGAYAPYMQSMRTEIYAEVLERLRSTGLLYGCRCRRADLLASSAPHTTDGRPLYAGTCRPPVMPQLPAASLPTNMAIRIAVDEGNICFEDMYCGICTYSPANECGDFVLRRSDGNFAYQLAVVADDAAMQMSQVVRGCDLLPSAAQQIYLFRLLGLTPPRYGHIPLLCNAAGQRLSKRDKSLSMAELRHHFTPAQVIGRFAYMAGLIPDCEPCSPADLLSLPTPIDYLKSKSITIDENLFSTSS